MGRPKSNSQHAPHRIAEWATFRRKKRGDIARDLDVDKSSVMRWFQGGGITDHYRDALADYFDIEPFGLFMVPSSYELLMEFLRQDPALHGQMAETLRIAFSGRGLPPGAEPAPPKATRSR